MSEQTRPPWLAEAVAEEPGPTPEQVAANLERWAKAIAYENEVRRTQLEAENATLRFELSELRAELTRLRALPERMIALAERRAHEWGQTFCVGSTLADQLRAMLNEQAGEA